MEVLGLDMPFAFCISVTGHLVLLYLTYLENCHRIVMRLVFICIYENYCFTLW